MIGKPGLEGFPERLNHVRDVLNHESQEQCGARVGASRQAVSKWEGGTIPDAKYIVELSDSYGVTTDFLLKGFEPIHMPSHPPTERKTLPPYLQTIIKVTGIAFGIAMVLFLLTLAFSLIPN